MEQGSHEHRIEQLLARGSEPTAWMPDPDDPVVVYGAGRTGRDLVAALAARGVPVLAVLDRAGARLSQSVGVPVFVPGEEPLSASARATTPILLGVHNRDADVSAIADTVCRLGYRQVVSFVSAHRGLSDALGERYWLADTSSYGGAWQDILDGSRRLKDDASRRLYADIMAWRLTGDPTAAPRPGAGTQYFPPDVPRAPVPLRLVDGGAYDGDTLRRIADAAVPIEQAWAFEPDASNFAELARTVRRLSGQTGAAVECWPCALAGQSGPLRFAAGGGEASRLDEAGTTIVPAVALDDVLPGSRPTMVKLDVEGAEPEALAGATEMLVRARPQLAVCVYHRADHLWSVSREVAALDLGYDFYLRAHAWSGFDVVLYGVPRGTSGRT
jgi:FkbM family methyltransferase